MNQSTSSGVVCLHAAPKEKINALNNFTKVKTNIYLTWSWRIAHQTFDALLYLVYRYLNIGMIQLGIVFGYTATHASVF